MLGGYELGCYSVVNKLRDFGHDVRVLTSVSHYGNEDEYDENSDHISRTLEFSAFHPNLNYPAEISKYLDFKSKVSNYTNTAKLLEQIKVFNPDCVYLYNILGIGGLGIVDLLNKINIPWAFHLMDRIPELLIERVPYEVTSIFRAKDFKCYENASLISMSQGLIEEIENLTNVKFSNEIHYVPGWSPEVDTLKIYRTNKKESMIKFVNSGAVKSHKGIDLIIEAAKLLKSKGKVDFIIDIYGAGDIPTYIDKAKQANVGELISFKGSKTIHELLDLYHDYDAFLFPTWEREPFGFAPIEAGAAGCIPIITSTAGVSEQLMDRVHCIKIDRNPESLLNAMELIYDNSIDIDRIKKNIISLVRSNLSLNFCARRIEEILKKLVGNSQFSSSGINEKINQITYLKHCVATKLYFK
ncbi:putative glycosyltransferase [Vibrio cholerae]|nr:putative glycosyltransferase [Vibrio cholerae]